MNTQRIHPGHESLMRAEGSNPAGTNGVREAAISRSEGRASSVMKRRKMRPAVRCPLRPKHGVGDVAAVELPDGKKVECGDKASKPAGKEKRVVVHFSHRW